MNKVKDRLIRAVIAFVIFIVDIILVKTIGLAWYIELPICIVSYLIAGYDILYKAIRNISHGQVFDENFLMILATIGAFATLQFEEAVMVIVLYQVGEAFQDYAVNKSRSSISELMDLRPEYANIIKDNEVIKVDPEEVNIGDVIVVKPGEKVPLDGKIIEGETELDTKSLTGETKLQAVGVGDNIISGALNQTGLIKVEATKLYEDSTVANILELVETSSEKKAKTENFIAKFAKYYTPIVVILALLLAIIPPLIILLINKENVFADYIMRACSFLVISCPCALVISVPLSFFGGIGGASKKGILIKGANYVEKLANIKRVAFDKTGTLTKGNFAVTKVFSINNNSEEVLKYAAYAECYSNHPLAISIKNYYNKTIDQEEISSIVELPGKGIKLIMNEDTYLVGNAKLLNSFNIKYTETKDIGTIVYVVKNDNYLGYILIGDEIKPETKEVIKNLNELGINETIMLSGDNKEIALKVANEIGLSKVKANLLPQDKVTAIEEELKLNTGVLAYCGDGINDAPVLMRSDIGIAMGGIGSDAAIEASDVIIMDDNLKKIPFAIKLAKKIMKIVYENIIFAIAIKIVVLILGAFGLASMWLAIFADVGVACICIINAMRTLYNKE